MASPAPSLRLYVTDPLQSGVSTCLSVEQSRYVIQVMRRRAGDPVLLFNGRDGEWRAPISQIEKKTVTVMVDSQTQAQRVEPDLWLLFAPVKRTAIDLIVQKATELGVSVLNPVTTAHTNADRVNVTRLTSIAIEAAEQSRRLSVPIVRNPGSLADTVHAWSDERPLYVLDETGSGAPIAQVLAESGAPQPAQAPNGGAFVIGPEGGFAKSELDLLRALPFSRFVSVGPRILRAETAALAALTCWQALCGDWRDGMQTSVADT